MFLVEAVTVSGFRVTNIFGVFMSVVEYGIITYNITIDKTWNTLYSLQHGMAAPRLRGFYTQKPSSLAINIHYTSNCRPNITAATKSNYTSSARRKWPYGNSFLFSIIHSFQSQAWCHPFGAIWYLNCQQQQNTRKSSFTNYRQVLKYVQFSWYVHFKSFKLRQVLPQHQAGHTWQILKHVPVKGSISICKLKWLASLCRVKLRLFSVRIHGSILIFFTKVSLQCLFTGCTHESFPLSSCKYSLSICAL